MKTKRVALYVRVSSGEQNTGAQERALREYVQRRGRKLHLSGPGHLRCEFESACSQRIDEGLSTRIGRRPRGLEIRQIRPLIEAAHLWARNVSSARDRFRIGNGGRRYIAASRRIALPNDWRRRPVRKIADRGTGEVRTGECPCKRKSTGTASPA